MAKEPKKTEADVARELITGKVEVQPEPKASKVEDRLAALEAYVKANAKANGWPEFEG